MRCWIDNLTPVLESLELDLTNGGRIKVNGPLWQSAAWRWNRRDFEWRVRERENSDKAMCGSYRTVVF